LIRPLFRWEDPVVKRLACLPLFLSLRLAALRRLSLGSRPSSLAVCLLVALSAAPARGQTTGIRELRADQVKPAFSVEPVVQRLSARRGQLVPFKFRLTSLARQTTIDIRPVAMRQELSGSIQPDADNPPPKEVTLTSATRLELLEDADTAIEGTIRVPTTNSPFHTFGILVTDFGRKLDGAQPRDAAASQVAIEFVTRYLLRIDLDIDGVRPTDAGKLLLEAGELIEADGRPLARVTVVNPTESPLEFELACRLLSPGDGSAGRGFPLHMPIRGNLDPPDRYVARILPGARIRLEEFVPGTVFPGAQELEATISAAKRQWQTLRFPVVVDPTAFPAQAALVAQLAPGVSVAPAQIELSTRRGGARFLPVTVTNSSTEQVDVTLAALGPDGSATQMFSVRPETFSLAPGGSRKVLATLGSDRSAAVDLYGTLLVQSRSASGAASGETRLTAALTVGDSAKPELKLGDLGWRTDGSVPAIILPVTNIGSRHAALEGKLALTEIDSGVRHEFSAGFGRWLLPGATEPLAFRISRKVPSGRYELKLHVRAGEGLPTLELKTLIEFADGP